MTPSSLGVRDEADGVKMLPMVNGAWESIPLGTSSFGISIVYVMFDRVKGGGVAVVAVDQTCSDEEGVVVTGVMLASVVLLFVV